MQRFERCRDDVRRAPDRPTVQRVLIDCMGNLTPEMTASLPTLCQHVLQHPGEELEAAALIFLQAELKLAGGAAGGALLKDIADTYAVAAQRMRDLRRAES